MSRLDIIIFGATGFTGRRIVPRLHEILKKENLNLTWGIAGRSKNKLKEVLIEAEQKTGDKLDEIEIIEADINNESSLKSMTSKTKLLINTVGPFRFYGEQVVQACLSTGTHHLDVAGEPQFMEEIQYKYHKIAMEKGIYLISACGMDSIPADMGVIHLQNNFDGTLNSIDSYHYGVEENGPHPGPELNYATWISAVYGVGKAKELTELRKKLFAKRLPKCLPPPQKRSTIHKNEEINRWCIPFPAADRAVLSRTQRYFYEENQQRPIHIRCYWGFEELSSILKSAAVAPLFMAFCKTEPTRKLLVKYPGFFSGGAFTTGGPSEEKMENTLFYVKLDAEGWAEKPEKDVCKDFDKAPDKKMVVRVAGRNPGYGITSTTVSLAAITVLTEQDKMPNKGGCYPPGYAFAKTSLIERLNRNELKFEIVSKL
nr:saccharopine dehydrogenase-like oxidoreductase [Onthophagus taurus]XP_022910545.1 saccharopine dehydrogenase-like oxidoreductase [Onthophagus taurus]